MMRWMRERSKIQLAAVSAAILLLLGLLPSFVGVYQTQLLTYGLIAAIAALGFNLLLGYTGLLSFGHSAFFGIGSYSVAFLARDLGIHSMELYILVGLPISALLSALFGYICVRHTRIFFGILTLALSQVLYSLAYKLFWVTGGSDGLRVPRPTLLGGFFSFSGSGAFQRFVDAYYYYVLAAFAVCVVIMWVIVHSPFGKSLQAIRDNEVRAAFLGLRIRRFRWISFLDLGHLHRARRHPLGAAQRLDDARTCSTGHSRAKSCLPRCSAGFATLPDRSWAASCLPI